MSYLVDSSSIFRAIKENRIEILAGNCTLELARYELGNILWKEHTLRQRITAEELERLIKLVKNVLNLMQVLTIGCHEEKILDTATKLKLTFYDASYLRYAKENKLTLVTEDSALIDKADQHVKALKLDKMAS